MAKFTTSDIIDFTIDKDTVGVATVVNELMKEKVADALAVKKVDVANGLLNSEKS